MAQNPRDAAAEAEAAQAALRDSIERARELVVEAKHQIADPKPEPPNAAASFGP